MLPALNLAAWSVGHTELSADTDRSVQGSLRVAKQDMDAWLYRVQNVMDLDPLKVSCWLNERPTTVYGKVLWPERTMLAAVGRI